MDLGKNQGYQDLSPDATRNSLEFYDAADIFDTVFDVGVIVGDQPFYFDYRYEGACWLTQRNLQCTGRPRTCQVYYVEHP